MSVFYIISLLLLQSYFSTISAQSTHFRPQTTEALIEENNKTTDTLYLRQHKQAIISSGYHTIPSEITEAVYNILLANAYARTYDSINSHSDRLLSEAVDRLEDHGENGLIIWANIQYGLYYYTYRQLGKARPYFVRAMHLIEKTPFEQIPVAADNFKKIAYFIITLGEHNRGIEYLKSAQKFAKPDSREMGDILNSIGRCYYELGKHSVAEEYFNQALSVSQKSGDYVRQAKVWGDIGLLFQHQHNFQKAEEAFLKDISLSSGYDNPQNTMFAYTLLARLYLLKDMPGKAGETLEKAYAIAQSKPYYKTNEYQIVKLQVEVAQKFNNDQQELAARRQLDILEKEISQLDGDRVVQQVSLEAQKEIINLSLDAEHHKRKQDIYVRNTIIMFGIVVILLLLIFVISYRRRNRLRLASYENKVIKLQLEKVTSENKLNATRKTLANYREYLSERNSQIDTLKQELKMIGNSTFPVPEDNKRKLQELLQSHLMSESNWQAFKEAFAHEEPEYYQYILEHFTDLTDSNLRILFLQKLGFNNPKTAQILGITLDAVKKNKQRMRKKYGLAYTQYLSQQKLEEEDSDSAG